MNKTDEEKKAGESYKTQQMLNPRVSDLVSPCVWVWETTNQARW